MKKHFLPLILALFCVFSFFSCHKKTNLTEEDKVRIVADSFSTSYFTWHFDHAMKYSDDAMKHYLTFIASNVHKADLDLLLSTSTIPAISVGDITINGDTAATATIDLKDVILMDSLGEEAHLYPNAQRMLLLRKDYGEWKVNMIK